MARDLLLAEPGFALSYAVASASDFVPIDEIGTTPDITEGIPFDKLRTL